MSGMLIGIGSTQDSTLSESLAVQTLFPSLLGEAPDHQSRLVRRVIRFKAYDADLIEWETLSSMRMDIAAFARRRPARRLLGSATNERRMSEIK
jgi:hypothetical protein